jgi:hypothetical protein
MVIKRCPVRLVEVSESLVPPGSDGTSLCQARVTLPQSRVDPMISIELTREERDELVRLFKKKSFGFALTLESEE